MLLGGRGIPRDVGGAALEEVGNEHAVFLVGRRSEDVGTLDGLVEEAEDVCISRNCISEWSWCIPHGEMSD